MLSHPWRACWPVAARAVRLSNDGDLSWIILHSLSSGNVPKIIPDIGHRGRWPLRCNDAKQPGPYRFLAWPRISNYSCGDRGSDSVR